MDTPLIFLICAFLTQIADRSYPIIIEEGLREEKNKNAMFSQIKEIKLGINSLRDQTKVKVLKRALFFRRLTYLLFILFGLSLFGVV